MPRIFAATAGNNFSMEVHGTFLDRIKGMPILMEGIGTSLPFSHLVNPV